jgi:predicted HTH domain antitoxin
MRDGVGRLGIIPSRPFLLSVVRLVLFRQQDCCYRTISLCDNPNDRTVAETVAREQSQTVLKSELILLLIVFVELAPIASGVPANECDRDLGTIIPTECRLTIQITYPDELLNLAGLTRDQFTYLAQKSILIRFYTLGAISTGKAAELLGVSRREFLELLGRYSVSEFDDDIDLKTELQRG